MDKVVDLWNKGRKQQQIPVTVKKQASGDSLVTKILTAHKAKKAPDLVQVEYQALPTLVSNDALADIAASRRRRRPSSPTASGSRRRWVRTRSTRSRRTSAR